MLYPVSHECCTILPLCWISNLYILVLYAVFDGVRWFVYENLMLWQINVTTTMAIILTWEQNETMLCPLCTVARALLACLQMVVTAAQYCGDHSLTRWWVEVQGIFSTLLSWLIKSKHFNPCSTDHSQTAIKDLNKIPKLNKFPVVIVIQRTTSYWY